MAKFWPWALFTALIVVFFYPYFFQGLVPIPADIIVGLYFPWLDYHWAGLATQTPVKNALVSDIVSVLYPFKMLGVDQLLGGSLPFWNPSIFNGTPLLANFQSAFFYPLTLLYFVLPKVDAWSLSVVAQPFLAMVFTFLLLRAVGLSRISSSLGAIIYSFAGFNIIWLGYNAHGHTAALIPLILLVTFKFFNTCKLRWLTLLSLAVTLQVFAGYPQLAIYTLILSFAWSVFLIISKKLSVVKLAAWCFFILVGIVLASVQIFPSFELYQLSQRSQEGIPGGQSLAFLPWQNLITLIAPDFFGSPATGNFWGVGDYTNTVAYVGLVGLVLVILALLHSQKNPYVNFWVVTTVVILLLSLPTPLAQTARNLPFVGGGAAATRMLALFNLSTAILAAFGMEVLIYKKLKLRQILASVIYPWAALVGIFIAMGLSIVIVGYQDKIVSVAVRNIILPTVMMIVLTTILISYRPKWASFSAWLILVLLIFELFRFGQKYTSFSQKVFLYPPTPITDFLSKNASFSRVYTGEVIPKNLWTPYGLEATQGYDAIYPERNARFLGAINTKNAASPTGRYGDITNVFSPLFDLAGNKYLLALKRNAQSIPDANGTVLEFYLQPPFVPVFSDGRVQVLENTKAAPRTFMVYDYVVGAGDEEIINQMHQLNLLQTAVLEKDPITKYNSGSFETKILTKTPGSIRLSVKTDQTGLLILTDSYYPGWKAYVDGKMKEIWRADFVFRAVEIPQGEHPVEFVYQSDIFAWGLFSTCVAAAFLLLTSLWSIKTKVW
ncbi:YfhO family protein [Candidatus Daviesbacteria bacterium]|nr:YfhO family protein [Candidatus Daviesbacteria bacterium]